MADGRSMTVAYREHFADGAPRLRERKKMSLVACKVCKKEVARSAKTCPGCGVGKPAEKPPSVKDSLIGLAGLAVIVGGTFTYCSYESDSDKAARLQKQKEEAAACAKDLRCLGEKAIMHAGFRCTTPIEQHATNSAKWTDGTLEPKFSRYRWRNKEATVVTVIGDKVQFQNGFGAHINMVYECDINMNDGAREVVAVRVREGRLD